MDQLLPTVLSREKRSVAVIPTVEDFVRNSRSENTWKAYRSDWKRFTAWCDAFQLKPLPATPQTIARYLSEMALTHKASSIHRRMMAISAAHQVASQPNPIQSELVKDIYSGIRRAKGARKSKKQALRSVHLKQLQGHFTNSLSDTRDKALLLIAYAGAFRRSELVSIQVADLQFVEGGVRIIVRKSKSDQEGMGITKDIGRSVRKELCPVAALEDWLRLSGIQSGPVFRGIDRHGVVQGQALSAQSVAIIVKKLVARIGLDPADYSGHSMRAGFVTDCIKAGVQTLVIKKVTGHKFDGSLNEYFRESDLFSYGITERLGL